MSIKLVQKSSNAVKRLRQAERLAVADHAKLEKLELKRDELNVGMTMLRAS